MKNSFGLLKITLSVDVGPTANITVLIQPMWEHGKSHQLLVASLVSSSELIFTNDVLHPLGYIYSGVFLSLLGLKWSLAFFLSTFILEYRNVTDFLSLFCLGVFHCFDESAY